MAEEENQEPQSNYGTSTHVAELRAQIQALSALIVALEARVTILDGGP